MPPDIADDPDIVRFNKLMDNDYKKTLKSKYLPTSKVAGAHRRFSPYLHEKYDTKARNKLKQVLGDFITDNPDIYKQDFLINSDTCRYKYLEVQVCSQWIGSRYPWKTLWIFARKSVYLDDSNSTLFITLNNNLTKGFLFDVDSIKNVKPRRMQKYSREYVYDIPWHRVMTVHLNHFDKETVEMY